jgi:acetoin utilization deacetylase AcuC-like enzyme
MATLFTSHDDCLNHEIAPGHPENPDRLRVVEKVLSGDRFGDLEHIEAPLGTLEQVLLAHPDDYIKSIADARPSEGFVHLDADTVLSPGSWDAALRGVGAITDAIEKVVDRKFDNAFVATRPPGHHAEARRAMGFCIFNSAAIGALHARENLGLDRVAVVDFDVHHGNGTQDIFWDRKDLFYASTHQMPLYPGTGAYTETGVGNIFNAPLSPGADGVDFREAMNEVILPALDAFRPDLIIISAGFDAHIRDPLANINLVEDDFVWITSKLLDAADRHADGRLVSILEGGYDLDALGSSVGEHVSALMAD